MKTDENRLELGSVYHDDPKVNLNQTAREIDMWNKMVSL